MFIQPGKVYKGYFYNDKKHGYGMFKYENDSFLIGKWIEDIMEGLAIFYEPDKTEELIVFRRHREKKTITENDQIENLKKSDDYHNLLIFIKEMNYRML